MRFFHSPEASRCEEHEDKVCEAPKEKKLLAESRQQKFRAEKKHFNKESFKIISQFPARHTAVVEIVFAH